MEASARRILLLKIFREESEDLGYIQVNSEYSLHLVHSYIGGGDNEMEVIIFITIFYN